MPSIFSRLKPRDAAKSKSRKGSQFDHLADQGPPKPRWEDAYLRKTVEPEEVQDLIHRCIEELKARALDHPFLLLPFRPTSDPSAVRTFIRHAFDDNQTLRGEVLSQELRMTEPMVIAGVVKWCWTRLEGGVIGWDAYGLFKVGEQDSNMARNSFTTFIPLSVDNGARSRIIFDFFDLLSAIAAHGKMNGLGGRKLSRMAAWWAFEHKDTGSGFEGGYNAWLSAADATSHLFFAYLRSLSPESPVSGISMLPMSLQKLLQETEYPPERPSLMSSTTNRVLMTVDTVSPTPFSLLRRANHFQYRDEDRALREFSEYEDPVQALTEECRRVLKAISSANQSQVSSSKHSTSLRDASWSRFEDIGFASPLDEEDEEDDGAVKKLQGLRTTPASGGVGLARPTTPSWADFLSSGFVDDNPNSPSNLLLPPDKILPPIATAARQRSSQSHRPRLETERHVEPGELASITKFDLDDSFWWVWISSLAPEETAERKAAFGRCAVVETIIKTGRWLVMEEMVVGAAPEPAEGAYVAEKKSFFSWTRRSKGLGRRKSTGKQALDRGENKLSQSHPGFSKTSIGPDQHARIQAAAAQLQAKQDQERALLQQQQQQKERRGRSDYDVMQDKTNSVLTMQPVIMTEASPALQWANKYDKEAFREAYLKDSNAGRGAGVPSSSKYGTNGHATNGHTNGYEKAPEVPSKEPSLLPQPSPLPHTSSMPISPVPRADDDEPRLSEKAVEAPADLHPAERSEPGGRSTPLPPVKEPESMELSRDSMVSPEPDLSPESRKQQKKLHKENKAASGSSSGFKRLFGRKNRSSKLPENAAVDLNGMLAADRQTEPTPVSAPAPVAAPVPTPAPVAVPAPKAPEVERAMPAPAPVVHDDPMRTPTANTPGTRTPTVGQIPEPYEASVDDNLSRADTEDAMEARREFSRFDQGPLVEQPAFLPDDDSSDDAVPPPIARRAREPEVMEESAPSPVVETAKVEQVPVQDRWAQIRKNAAERAAQRQSEDHNSRGGQSKTTDGDDDTSGEETIESRVARIKARVAELTGNMEGTGVNGPGSQTPPIRRAPLG